MRPSCRHDARRDACPDRLASGLFWGRIADVPNGMRAQVWLDSDGHSIRGGYSAIPWYGEIEGTVAPEGSAHVTMLERGAVQALGAHRREATLRWNTARTELSGVDSQGHTIDLIRAGFPSPALRPGLWIARWTGLPYGLAVETRVQQDPDGHFRAQYQYQGTGGVRDGSFDGAVDEAGNLSIRWMEIATDSGTVARGLARLSPSEFGLRGTFGIATAAEGVGEWVLEPLGPILGQ